MANKNPAALDSQPSELTPEKVLPLTLWAESGQQLFGCAWYEGEGTLTLFEQTAAGSRVQKQQSVSPWDAFPAARRLLEEAVSPEGFRVKMRETHGIFILRSCPAWNRNGNSPNSRSFQKRNTPLRTPLK